MRIDGANLLDNILENGTQEGIDLGKISTGQSEFETIRTEELTKGEQTAEVTYQKPGQEEKKGGTVQDIMEQAENLDAVQMKNEMVVAANTTTPRDCKELKEDGFSLQQTEIHTVITETDKIKMVLAKAGVDVSYFGDALSAGQLAEMTGSTALARQLAGKMEQADVPPTAKNLEDAKEALQQAEDLKPLNDGALKYMLDNQLEPTIANLYKAQYSGSMVYTKSTGQEDFLGMQGQISRVIAQSGRAKDEEAAEDSKWLLSNQVLLTPENLRLLGQLKSLGLPPAPDQAQDAVVTALAEGKRPWDAALIADYSLLGKAEHAVNVVQETTDEELAYVVSRQESVTIENLERAHYEMAAGLEPELQQQVEELAQTPHLETENTDQHKGQSVSGYTQYTEIQITMVISRRQLEEARLSMTREASFAMLKLGLEIDTHPMEELITELKSVEDSYFKNLLAQGGAPASTVSVSLFSEVTTKLEQIKEMPAYTLGIPEVDISTLNRLHTAGSELKQSFQQANQRYETMQTQVREELGDSIEKAFEGIDEILTDLGLDTSEANERAVRILAYNQTEITGQSIMQIKAVDQQVQMAFHNLTPSVVRELITRGIHPLDMDIIALNQTAEQIKQELGIDTPEEKFSEYLYKLERNHAITNEERSSYIGIFRLINQVVQSDGAAIGALVNQGADITMRNLLMAVRTAKRGAFNTSVDDSAGEIKQAGYKDAITAQIEAGYQDKCMAQALDTLSPERLRNVTNDTDWQELTPEQFLVKLQEAPEDLSAEEDFYRQQLEDFTLCTQASTEVYETLRQYQIPNSMANVIAMAELMADRNQAYRRLFGMGNGRDVDSNRNITTYAKKTAYGEIEVDFDTIREELLEKFSENVKRPEGLAEAMAELADCAEHCMSTMILEKDVTSLDIRQLKLMNTQISFGPQLARDECFSLPIVVDGEVVNVTLKIVRDKKQKGCVNVALETERLGRVAAEFRAKQDAITGYVVSDSRQTLEQMKHMQADLQAALREDEQQDVDIRYVSSTRLDLNQFVAASGSGEQPESEEDRTIQTETLYHMAESFLTFVKQL